MPHPQPEPGPSWLRLFRKKAPCEAALREAVEGYIEEAPPADPAASHERAMLGNILKLRDLVATDVAVPRADIVAVERGVEPGALLALLAEKGYNRVPVYSGTLDEVAGVLYIKDVLAAVASGVAWRVEDLIRPAQIIAPSMPVLSLLAEMRRSRRHMALVVDEFGGIDGLVTIGDIIEAIVGETAGEHDHAETAPQMVAEAGGAILADARVPVFAHLEGICHVYVDAAADAEMARRVVLNAKTRRTGICGAAECLLVHRAAAGLGQTIVDDLMAAGVEVYAEGLAGTRPATQADWGTEFLDMKIAARLVDDIDDAMDHIRRHGSGHTDAIVTADDAAAERFFAGLDSAILMRNASTQFADGGEFGMGAEIGIATGKLHARGPVGAEQLTSFKYLVEGDGAVRG